MENSKIKIAIAVISVILVIVVAAYAYSIFKKEKPVIKNETEESLTEKLPSVEELKSISISNEDDEKISIEELLETGKPIIINFWTTWADSCIETMPLYSKYYEQYSDKIEFVMINLTDGYNETKKGVESFARLNNYAFPLYYDYGYVIKEQYNITNVPTVFFIDNTGKIINKKVGKITEDMLSANIDILLNNI